ncbi:MULTISPECIES: DUF2812 domain-containing protein [Clostridium]|uniref:DUF2812 domain-containing protein n=3 Tax=Clostridium TaxID=1485 RepID=D8GSH1_CLOLD|nr:MULTISPECIES: DUF2812 domain-containing protein [Clostridium]ADK16553.1 conserved hypothetical protein [Clostridium ljungdahlii DSM 13528]ALU35809.1 Hypothetical protein CLAU_1380 [Clostridium autoethanogenum DSM 10061]OAA89577.1 hypothetical protein WX45_01409 [Clostridium ljungdahlii DSM 13528]OVY52132.1 hypothetical protein WX72_01024 [Clostridium autoethanogenum]RMD04188.1 DUF2812 domain-containing protein [Clostridium autoethanogenum]
MLKFKLYYDKDAEEAWLKKMCLDGWEFKKFFLGFYTFKPCEPGEYNYQIDLLDNWKGDTVDYSSFMSNVGVQVVGQWWRWVYLKKKASDGPFEMYTDVESKIAQYRRIGNLFKVFSFVEAICFFVELIGAVNTGDYIFVIFTVLLAAIFLTMIRIVWKCKLKIEKFKREGM